MCLTTVGVRADANLKSRIWVWVGVLVHCSVFNYLAYLF